MRPGSILMVRPSPHRALLAITIVVVGAAAGGWGEELVTGQLEIRGAVLRVSPARQDIDPGRPTVVHTALGDLRPDQVPTGLRVVGDLSGPGLDQPLRVTTVPGDPFRIPGLNREGTYLLSGIRLMDGSRVVSSAVPDTAEIVVHRLVISSITSRALTPDEMDAYGIVIDDDNYTAWHYTVGFQIEGGSVEVPFNLMVGPQGITLLDSPNAYALEVPRPDLPELHVPTVNSGSLEPIPSTTLNLPAHDSEMLNSTPIPGFIIIPTDIAFLHQFFSVIMVVQNGALAGSGLELRDLTGVLELSGDGVRQAETNPPTIPGESVHVLDPGPDGVPGTGDDLTFIVAQASGQATWLLEGLREGQHRLTARLTGAIHGLASGQLALIEGTIPGVVVVRDPRFSLTFFHPNVVRTGEYYDFRVSVANTSTTPVYDLSMELPTNAISGAVLAPSEDGTGYATDPVQRVPELLPGSTGMVTWKLKSQRTGRVVASAFNSSNAIDARFVFEIGIGELGIPLSPESIVLPPTVDALPDAVVQPALELLGLAHSLANAPNGVEVDLPPVGENTVMLRGTGLAAAGQRYAFGEPVDRTVVGFELEWMGSTHWSSSFDVLRRRSRRGHELENATAYHLGLRMEEIGDTAALDELEELGITGRPMLLVSAEGAGFDGGARLALVGGVSGRKAVGQRADVDFFARNLEGAAIFGVDSNVWAGEVGVVAVPLDDESGWLEQGYQVQLWGVVQGSVDLQIVIVMPDGSTRRFTPPDPLETRNGSLATIDIGPDLDSAVLWLDTDGDGFNLGWEEISVEVRNSPQASVIAARFEDTVNPVRGGPYRNVVMLLSQPVDGAALGSMDPEEWLIESELEIPGAGGGTETFSRDRRGRSFRLQLDPRIFSATFSVPLNPHAALRLSSGSSPLPLVGGGELEIIDQPISIGGGLESGSVRGVVLGPDGGSLAHAGLELYEMVEFCHAIEGCSWLQSLSDRVQADAAGGFLFDAVRYRDQAIPSQQAAFMVRAVDPETGHETRLAARLPGDNTTRSLTLAMVGRGDVVGTLRRADGSPLGNPTVTARSITNPTEGAQVVPDVSGRFRLTDLPVGPIQILARDGDAYTFATAQITGPGAEATVDLVLQVFSQPLASVDGRVVDGATAEPVPGLDIYVIPAGFQGPTHVATSGGDGSFSMTGVPPGVSRFKAWNPALGRYVAEAVADLLGDTTTTIEMIVRPGETGSIVGTVTLVVGGAEVPVEGGYVVAREQGLFTLTDGDGRYELTNLPLGQIDLEVWDPATAASTTRTVDLTADGQVLVLDFVLREDNGAGSVTVNVANGNGVPEVGADVALVRFGSGLEGRTGGDGSVRIEGVPPGKHDVLVRLGRRLARGQVKVLYPGHAASINLVLGGLARAKVWATGDQTGGGTAVVRTPISYRVPGVTSTGRIGGVPEEGWTECELDEDSICWIEDLPTNVGSLIAVATSGFYGQVTVSKYIDHVGEHELVINFQALGEIGGRVVRNGPEGPLPVEGATVELWIEGPSWGLIPLDKHPTQGDGAFHFELVKRGSFSLRVYHPTLGVTWLNGTIGSGQVIDDLELSLRGRAAIEGEVALCYDKSLAKAGSQVRVTLRPANVPRPFISDIEIADLADGILDVTLGDDERAPFMFADRMIGGWTLTATSALHGSAFEPVNIGPEGETTVLSEPLCLHPTGSVSGLVSFAENGEPGASVTVQLFRGSDYLTTDSTGEDGLYTFSDIPIGPAYHVRAYDAATNRGGISAVARLCDTSDSGYGVNCSRDAVLDVVLSPMGRLEGALRDHDQLPVASAHVVLRTSVVVNETGQVQSFQREWTTFTAADGSFAFDGVPAGTAVLTAFDPASPLYVERSLQVDPVGSPVTQFDLELPPTAEVSVRVLDPFGVGLEGGDPVAVFRQWSGDYFREPSGSLPTVEHLVTGATPLFAGVVADRYSVGACFGDCASEDVGRILGHQFITALGASSAQRMPNPPADQVVDLMLVGRAAVSVTVTRDGQPLEGAEVRITGSGFYGPREVISTTGADGTVGPIAGLGVGTYDVTASKREGLNTTGGSTEVAILQSDHGSVIDVVVSAESVASADGRVLDPTGEPSAGALINMHTGGRVFQAVSGDDGTFSFPALPSNATYTLEAYAVNGLGRHTLRGIVVGTDLLHLGDLVLDELNPWVSSTVPANGFQGADTDVDVVIDFSERMRYATLTGNSIRLREQGSGAVVSTNSTIEDQPDPDGDGPLQAFSRVTLSHGPLASERLYLIDVLKSVEDLAGRSPAFDYHATFRTRDTVPPEVLSVIPPNDLDGITPVGPDVVPIISCSESMDPESVNASTVQLLDGDDQPVEAILDLQRDGYDIRIRPTTALELDTFYTVILEGVTDAAGLPLAESYSWTFRVRDIEPPVVTLLEPIGATVNGGTWTALEGRPLTLRAAVASNDALKTVVITFNGVPASVQVDASGEYRREVIAPTGVPEVTVAAQAGDVSGNTSLPAVHTITLVDDQPPTGELTVDPIGEILPNHVLSITANVQDDHGLRRMVLSTTGVVEQEWTINVTGAAASETQEIRVPVEAIAGSQIVVSCEVEDTLGQKAPLPPATVTVSADADPPLITTLAPAPGSSFRAGEDVTFTFTLEDGVTVDSTSLDVDGEDVPVMIGTAVQPGSMWSAEASALWTVPEVAETREVTWTVTATDLAGNPGTATGTITVSPAQGPEDPVVRFVCPLSGDHCLPGAEVTVSFTLEDDDEIQHYSIFVDGVPLLEEMPVGTTSLDGQYTWIPPSDAGPGDEFVIRIVARDWNGNQGSASLRLTVPDGTVLTGDQELARPFVGESLVLGSGEFTATTELSPENLILVSGAILTTPVLQPLVVSVAGEVRVQCGAAIDVIGKGYPSAETYPGATLPGNYTGAGSHIGEGGSDQVPGSTFGSVTHPFEAGGTGKVGDWAMPGGGVVRLSAGSLKIAAGGTITASGSPAATSSHTASAGGSVWITAESLTGDGMIEARGAPSLHSYHGSGGGGAIAVEYEAIDQSIVDNIRAEGGDFWFEGGAGTIFLKGPASSFGDLIVDNHGVSGGRTVLPSLGMGEATAGSSGATLVTDRAAEVPRYFEGHWVAVFSPGWGELKGVWQVTGVAGLTITLEPSADVAEGDLWRGMYRFDSVRVLGSAELRLDDLDDFGLVEVDSYSVLELGNQGPPVIDPKFVTLYAANRSYRVVGTAEAVTDPDGIASVDVENRESGYTHWVQIFSDGTLRDTPVEGSPGDPVWLVADDGHRSPMRSSVVVGTLPPNLDVPFIDAEGVGNVLRADDLGHLRYWVEGVPGSVSDSEYSLHVIVTNDSTGWSRDDYVFEGEGFLIWIVGTPGDHFTLTVEDGHPDTGVSTLDLGAMPDLMNPVIHPELIMISARDGRFWLSSEEPAIWDDGEIVEAYAHDLSDESIHYPLEIGSDGVLASSPVTDRTGAILRIVVTDGGGNQRSALLPALPGNDGPPELDPAYLSLIGDAAGYTMTSLGSCAATEDPCGFPMRSLDGVTWAMLENRTPPFVGEIELALEGASCSADCDTWLYGFLPAHIEGAVGDEIWLIAADGHPLAEQAEALASVLPEIDGAPVVALDEDNLGFTQGDYLLAVPAGAVTDPDGPLSLEVSLWRLEAGVWSEVGSSQASLASGEAAEIPMSGGAFRDIVVVTATDAVGFTTTVRVGELPRPDTIAARFSATSYEVAEQGGGARLTVSLTHLPTEPVTVRYRTVGGTAVAGLDFEERDRTLEFGPGVLNRDIVIPILEDGEVEVPETFSVELLAWIGSEVADPAIAEVVIQDAGSVSVPITYSIRLGIENLIAYPVNAEIENGQIVFAESVSSGFDRGDMVVIDGRDPVYVTECDSVTRCRVTDSLGRPPADVSGVVVESILPAFDSLADAVASAADTNHLGTYDLEGSGRTLDLLCYGGGIESRGSPVVIDGWMTSPLHRVVISSPTAAQLRGESQRHSGYLDYSYYVLTVWGADAIRSTVGNLSLEGLQIIDGGTTHVGTSAIRLENIAGDVDIGECLIFAQRPYGADNYSYGLTATADSPVEVVLRNSEIAYVGNAPDNDHTGVYIGDADVQLYAANNTIVGGAYGIRVLDGTATVVNNLIAGVENSCYEGVFSVESGSNLASDGTAPNPPQVHTGAVTTIGGFDDVHLDCRMAAQNFTVYGTFSGPEAENLFDGDSSTLVVSPSANPALIVLEFPEPRTVLGASVLVSHYMAHSWEVAVADSLEDFDPPSGSYQEIVPRTDIVSPEHGWGSATFDEPVTSRFFGFRVYRDGGDDYVHVNELRLDGINPACGQGENLADHSDHPFGADVDSIARPGRWDIGADQHDGLTIGFTGHEYRLWGETEGPAQLEVALSEPAPTTISVRFRTGDVAGGGAVAGEDYQPVSGTLVFAPGEYSKSISVPFVEDGPANDPDEVFGVFLSGAVGATITSDAAYITIVEGEAPPRIRVVQRVIDVNESAGVAWIDLELSRPTEQDISGVVVAVDGSALGGADFHTEPSVWWENFVPFYMQRGETSISVPIPLVDDQWVEPIEGFRVIPNVPGAAESADSFTAYVRIHDDDGVAP